MRTNLKLERMLTYLMLQTAANISTDMAQVADKQLRQVCLRIALETAYSDAYRSWPWIPLTWHGIQSVAADGSWVDGETVTLVELQSSKAILMTQLTRSCERLGPHHRGRCATGSSSICQADGGAA